MVNNKRLDSWRQRARNLFSSRCLICERRYLDSSPLCQICDNLVEKQKLGEVLTCICCALPLDIGKAKDYLDVAPDLYCGECLKQPPPFERCLAAVKYSPISGKLVSCLKHHGNFAAITPIVSTMSESIEQAQVNTVDLIIPAPLHQKRLQQRGFNQSIEIAKALSKTFDITLDTRSMHRLTNDPPQQGKSRLDRQAHLAKSFQMSRSLSGMRIAIVDDVVTTTATASAIAKAAIQAGALNTEVWCFARTPSRHSSAAKR